MLNKKLVLAVDEACLVNARQKKLNHDNYHCPHCNKKVILVMSATETGVDEPSVTITILLSPSV